MNSTFYPPRQTCIITICLLVSFFSLSGGNFWSFLNFGFKGIRWYLAPLNGDVADLLEENGWLMILYTNIYLSCAFSAPIMGEVSATSE